MEQLVTVAVVEDLAGVDVSGGAARAGRLARVPRKAASAAVGELPLSYPGGRLATPGLWIFPDALEDLTFVAVPIVGFVLASRRRTRSFR